MRKVLGVLDIRLKVDIYSSILSFKAVEGLGHDLLLNVDFLENLIVTLNSLRYCGE